MNAIELTAKKLKRGEVHPLNPNLRFWRYAKDYPSGMWVTTEKFAELQKQITTYRINRQKAFAKPINRLKRGALHLSKDLIFWQYAPSCKNGELWLTPEKFAEKVKLAKEYQLQNKEATYATKRRFSIRHAERLREVRKGYNKLARERRPNYEKEKAAKDPVFNLSRRVRARIREALRDRRMQKSRRAVETVGCGWGELRNHLEALFTDGMSWDNMNLWHVDHIIPLALAKTEADVIRLSHFSNLQPLWASDNLRKSARMPG